VPKKSELEKMFGPESAAKTVKAKVAKIKSLSDTLAKLALNLTSSQKAIGKSGTRRIDITSGGSASNFICGMDLSDTGSFKKEDKLLIMDKINELVTEYLSRETAATYEEIQWLGKEL
jgi:hypothetical protein